MFRPSCVGHTLVAKQLLQRSNVFVMVENEGMTEQQSGWAGGPGSLMGSHPESLSHSKQKEGTLYILLRPAKLE